MKKNYFKLTSILFLFLMSAVHINAEDILLKKSQTLNISSSKQANNVVVEDDGSLVIKSPSKLTIGDSKTTGNVTLKNDGKVTVEEGAFLIINGNLIIENDGSLVIKGTVLVTGDITLKNDAKIGGSGALMYNGNISQGNDADIDEEVQKIDQNVVTSTLDAINISKSTTGKISVYIYNLNGQIVKAVENIEATNTKIDKSELAGEKGIFLVKVLDGAIVSNYKVYIQ